MPTPGVFAAIVDEDERILCLRMNYATHAWTTRHSYGRLEVAGGHGHVEVDPAATADDAINITRFEEVADHHLGASGSRPTPVGRLPRLPISIRHLPCTLPPRARQLPDYI
jgi:hypothetical protein